MVSQTACQMAMATRPACGDGRFGQAVPGEYSKERSQPFVRCGFTERAVRNILAATAAAAGLGKWAQLTVNESRQNPKAQRPCGRESGRLQGTAAVTHPTGREN